MFNFKTLKLDKREDTSNLSSFVGIRRGANGALEFRLPRGFEEFPDNDFNATKQLFFRMYSTFKKFERDRDSLELDLRALGKDNIERQNNSYRFRDKEDNDVILYSKISLIENLLEAYRDLALNVIERRNDLDEKINFSKIDHYLHKAIYLPNDVIFIEEMDFARQTLQYKSATLIELFCFILFELQNELKQETNTRVQELANRFGEQHLSHEQSLFKEETFEITIRTLKDILDDIDKRTTYKDDDYWRLYEAIETFLYGELDMETPHADGTFWGISNFSSVWEDMCTTYAFANFNVVYADSNIIFNGQCVANSRSAGHFPIFKKTNFTDPFYIEFRGKKRWMRPDLVHLISADESENETDWIFSEAIQIVFKRDNGVTADFEVKLIDKSRSAMYQGFCSNLKTAKTQGSRVIGDNSFRSYPKSELEKQKNRIIDIYSRNRIQSKLPSVLFRLLDWKYMDADSFIQGNKKVQTDSTKQLCYQFALQRLRPDSGINSQFVIPWFSGESNDDIGDYMDDAILHPRLRDNKLEVFKANFSKIQAVYLSHD
jgi:hypothetical protein